MTKILIFGASGDLSKRKLFPALSKLKNKKFEIIGYSRKNMDDSAFLEELKYLTSYDDKFIERIRYVSGQYDDLSKIDVPSVSVFYLSLPSQLHVSIIGQLIRKKASKIALEKPFGFGLKDFLEIKRLLESKDPSTNVYFIDHYLCKPMNVALSRILAEDQKLTSFLSSEHVENVEVIFKEKIGAEERASFDNSGIIMDIVQNHVAEIISTICSSRCTKRSSLFESACEIDVKNCLFGQYEGYEKEFGRRSKTETFCIIPLFFSHEVWKNVPFVVVAGKCLDKKFCEVRLEIRPSSYMKLHEIISLKEDKDDEYNFVFSEYYPFIRKAWIIFNYMPKTEILIEIKTGTLLKRYVLYGKNEILEIINMTYDNQKEHEIVLNGLINDKPFPYSTAEEIEAFWRVFDPVIFNEKNLISYEVGSDIMNEGKELIRRIKEGFE